MRVACRVASSVIRRAFSELLAISPIVAVISSVAEATLTRFAEALSMPEATDVTLALISSAAAATECARSEAGPELLGRVIDGFGKPLDGLGPIGAKEP